MREEEGWRFSLEGSQSGCVYVWRKQGSRQGGKGRSRARWVPGDGKRGGDAAEWGARLRAKKAGIVAMPAQYWSEATREGNILCGRCRILKSE